MDTKTDYRRGSEILAYAQSCYYRLDQFRKDRERNKRYNYGDQWSDELEYEGRRITEERYILEQGKVPLKNNMIRRLVRNVIGVYNAQSDAMKCVAREHSKHMAGVVINALLHHNMQVNRMAAVYARTFEEFLISGLIVHKKSYGKRLGVTDCWTDYVQPNNFFIDGMIRDFRGWDCSCIGEVHQVRFADLAVQLAADEDMYHRLRERYGAQDDNSRCTVTEVWRKETRRSYRCHDRHTGRMFTIDAKRRQDVDAENIKRADTGQAPIQLRWQVKEIWRYYFITPWGEILSEGDTPYAHHSHPYIFRAYPMIDGEIHSFVSDVIDQQRYTNRLITMYDWIMKSSSKGVLLVPEDCIPRGISPEYFVDNWTRHNGVIIYKPSANGAVPQQVANNSTNIGIKELLDLQLKFFEDISGVNNTLQGKASTHAVSAEMYGQQTMNATLTLSDIIDTFNEFVRDAAYMDISNICQYYDDERLLSVDANIDADVIRNCQCVIELPSCTMILGERSYPN